jgi:hypothetical protein
VRKFIDALLSSDTARIMPEYGFVPLPAAMRTSIQQQLNNVLSYRPNVSCNNPIEGNLGT